MFILLHGELLATDDGVGSSAGFFCFLVGVVSAFEENSESVWFF